MAGSIGQYNIPLESKESSPLNQPRKELGHGQDQKRLDITMVILPSSLDF